MYWDVYGASEEHAKSLFESFNCTANGRPQDATAGRTDGRSSLPGPSLPSRIHQSFSDRVDQSVYFPPPASSSNIEATLSGTTLAPSVLLIPRFLELCINRGVYAKTLGEVNVTEVGSDGELFQKIASMYYEKRSNHSVMLSKAPRFFENSWRRLSERWRLQKPASVIFRKVR